MNARIMAARAVAGAAMLSLAGCFTQPCAKDGLSVHEFDSKDAKVPNDVSVRWRVEWPEASSGLSGEGLVSVRRGILQMAFGPAWRDLNADGKAWTPPPTIGEAEDEIKSRLASLGTAWDFSGDVSLEWPFGKSSRDGAKWYARPVIVAMNDGNSNFGRQCGCTYYTQVKTFSLPDGKEMTVDDYFDGGKIRELSALVWKRLLEGAPLDDETRKEMGGAKIDLRDGDAVFMRVKEGGVCFYFAPYSVFAGSLGVTKACLTWEELSEFRRK